MDRVLSIDVGTNTVLGAVGELGRGGLTIVSDEERIVGLGRGVDQSRTLRPDRIAAALGARLVPAFTASELRREYRQIARRIHPDRHPHATAAEHERLARQFSDATTAYRTLRATVEPTH